MQLCLTSGLNQWVKYNAPKSRGETCWLQSQLKGNLALMLDLPPCWQACWISKVCVQQGVDADLHCSRLLTAICFTKFHTHKIAKHLTTPLEPNIKYAFIYSLTVHTLCAWPVKCGKKSWWPESIAVIITSRCVGLMKAWKVEWRVALSRQPHNRMTLGMRGIIKVYIISSLKGNLYFSRSPGWLAWLNLKLSPNRDIIYIIYVFSVTLPLFEMQIRQFQLHFSCKCWGQLI